MAKVTITLEDNPNGETVKVTASPVFQELAELSMSKRLTHAQGYAISALLHLRKCAGWSHKKKMRNRIIVPPSSS